jgi:hypothetical protein
MPRLTAFPGSRRGTQDFGLILAVIDDCTQSDTHNGQGWRILGGGRI